MSTPKEIYWALSRRRYPRMITNPPGFDPPANLSEKMKTTLWITSRANRDTRSHGYTVHVVDPSPGIDNERRSLASDFGAPITVDLPAGWIVADVDGMPTMCMEGNPMTLQWAWKLGKIHAWPQFATFEEAQRRGAVHEIKAPKLADLLPDAGEGVDFPAIRRDIDKARREFTEEEFSAAEHAELLEALAVLEAADSAVA